MTAIATIERARAFDPAIAAAICDRIAAGEGLDAICSTLSVSAQSVRRWLKSIDTFAEDYASARSMQLDKMSDELIPIADNDELKPEDRKVRVDTRKWLLSKLRASVYGDKLDVTSKGEALAAPSHMVDARVQSIVMQAEMRRRAALTDEAASLLE